MKILIEFDGDSVEFEVPASKIEMKPRKHPTHSPVYVLDFCLKAAPDHVLGCGKNGKPLCETVPAQLSSRSNAFCIFPTCSARIVFFKARVRAQNGHHAGE
jgi:hypothetical protein